MTVVHLPSLAQSLQGQDLGHLKIIAEAWGIESFNPPDARSGIQRLASEMPDAKPLEHVILHLPEAAQQAFFHLVYNDGQMAWALFTRRYGAVRNIGAARRDRDRPDLHPASPTEALWYRGLIGRSFFDTPDGPQEFAFIPGDILVLAPQSDQDRKYGLGRIASLAEREKISPATDKIVDHACTFLAARRAGQTDRNAFGDWTVSEYSLEVFLLFLEKCLAAAGLLDAQGLPIPDPVRKFLELDRQPALKQLLRTWLTSIAINDLRCLPGLVFEGQWSNDPLRARQIVLELLSSAPGQRIDLPGSSVGSQIEGGWTERSFVSLASFIQAVHQEHPDFQRPAGDYDSWFIRDGANDEYLRGFEHWASVDGAYLKYMICGPLAWLGLIDLAGPAAANDLTGRIQAFRLCANAQALLNLENPAQPGKEDEPWIIRSDGRIHVPRLSSRSARYQITRFCESEGLDNDVYHYRLTPASLERSRQQDLQVSHLLRLLRRQVKVLPPSLVEALERWETHGQLVQIEKLTVLRVKNPQILQALKSSRAARFLGDPLGPTSIIVKPAAIDAILKTLLEMGYLSDVKIDGG